MLRDRDYDRDHDRDQDDKQDAELTLGIGSLLGIFFGVVLVCGVFFGFGYSLGRHNPPSAPAQADAAPVGKHPRGRPNSSPPEEPASDAAAPQAASADAANPNFPANYQPPSPDEAAVPARTEHLRSGGTRVVESDTPENVLTTAEPPRPHVAPAKPRPIPASAPALPTSAPALVVQIAAVSRREDAEVLSTALRKHGFSPTVRNGLADSFYHVQVGPFTDRALAETTKQKLLADGYNAILK